MQKNYLPSKKFVIFLICLLLIILFVIFKKKIFKEEPSYTKEQRAFLNTKIEDFAKEDTDGDGLFDWEEALWATDPKKTDSDGDGISDKDYVKAKKEEFGINSTAEIENITETERISMEFFTVLSSLEQKGLLNEDSIKNIAGVFGEEILTPFEIDESSINTSFDITESTKTNSILYREKIMAILTKSQEGMVGKEAEYFSIYISEPTEKNRLEISKISKAYLEFSESLSKLSVPSDIQNVHKDLIINSAKLNIAIGLLTQYENDPVLAMKGFIVYQDISPKLEEGLYSLSAYFQKLNN